jgi:hypothetical protein
MRTRGGSASRPRWLSFVDINRNFKVSVGEHTSLQIREGLKVVTDKRKHIKSIFQLCTRLQTDNFAIKMEREGRYASTNAGMMMNSGGERQERRKVR